MAVGIPRTIKKARDCFAVVGSGRWGAGRCDVEAAHSMRHGVVPCDMRYEITPYAAACTVSPPVGDRSNHVAPLAKDAKVRSSSVEASELFMIEDVTYVQRDAIMPPHIIDHSVTDHKS